MTALPAILQQQARGVGARFADRLFEGRKGHGGGPCSRRVLSRVDLAEIVAAAWEVGYRAAQSESSSVDDADLCAACLHFQHGAAECGYGSSDGHCPCEGPREEAAAP